MSAEENKSLVLRSFLGIHNAPDDLGVIDETCAPTYAERQKAWHRMEREAFPDKHVVVQHADAEGDTVVLRWSARGTHLGPFWTPLGTAAATGKEVTLGGTTAYRVEGGRIAEEWACIDWLDAVQQLGAKARFPSPD